jgi:hypothetical protein
MPQNPLTLTRQTLYDLIWSRPISELAKEFRMSDGELAKRLRAVEVPYRGYWARKAAGQEPPKIPLTKYRSRTPTATAERYIALPPFPGLSWRYGKHPCMVIRSNSD